MASLSCSATCPSGTALSAGASTGYETQRRGTRLATSVSAAHALEALPEVARVFGEARLSFAQLYLLTRFVTADTDAEWAELGPSMSLHQLRQAARQARQPSNDAAKRATNTKMELVTWDEDRVDIDGTIVSGLGMAGWFPGREGATISAALQRELESQPRQDMRLLTHAGRVAHALVAVASHRVVDDTDADRATVVAHVDLESVVATNRGGTAALDGYGPVATATLARMLCDGRLQTIVEDTDGTPVAVGTMARTTPPWLNRWIRNRDTHCRFPGCDARRGMEAHHLTFWSHGGETTATNLMWLCRFHHHLCHEGGWTATGDANTDVTFQSPSRRKHTTRPPPLDRVTQAEIFGDAA
jgi:hypothetical protein